MQRFLLILTVFLGSLEACGPVHEFDLDQNFKDFVYYSPGSYWIYRDSANHLNKDSVIVLTNTYKIKEGGEKPTKTQTLSTHYYSSRDSIYVIDGEPDVYGHMELSGLGDYGYLDTIASINYFFADPSTSPDVGYPYSLTFPGTIKIKNTVYKDVEKFTVPRYNKTVYWSRHVGVIKSTYRGITWELDTCSAKQ